VLERIAFYGGTDGYKELQMVLDVSLSFDRRDGGPWGWHLLWSTWFTKPSDPGVTTTRHVAKKDVFWNERSRVIERMSVIE